jgi:hypothetical protein
MKTDELIDWDTVPFNAEAPIKTEQVLSKIEMGIVLNSEKLSMLNSGSVDIPKLELVKECLMAELNRLEIDRQMVFYIKAMQELGVS